MTHRLVWTNPKTGIVSIARTVAVKSTRKSLVEYAKIVVPEGTEFTIVTSKKVPTDPTFRSAWTETKGKFGVDITRAREIQKEVIRQARKPLMTELDYKQNDGEDVSERRATLKNYPMLVESIDDLEELKRCVPTVADIE